MVCFGQPLLVAGDLNADPAVIPCLAKGISAGRFVDLALAYSLGEVRRPDATCKFKREDCVGSRRDFMLGCSNALAACTACRVTDGWFAPYFSVCASFCINNWTAEVSCPVATQPIWPACWIDTRDKSSFSLSCAVLDAWDIYREELGVVPPDVVLAQRDALGRSDVDGFWTIWSTAAEAGLFNAYCRAGGPTAAGSAAFLGSGASRLYRVSQGDDVDAEGAPFFVNSSLAPVLLCRWRLESVADVLRGIKRHGYTQTRWDALQGYWGAVCRHGPCGPISSLGPWDGWIPSDLRGFF